MQIGVRHNFDLEQRELTEVVHKNHLGELMGLRSSSLVAGEVDHKSCLDQLHEKSHDYLHEMSHDQIHEKIHDYLREKSHDQLHEKSHDFLHAMSHDHEQKEGGRKSCLEVRHKMSWDPKVGAHNYYLASMVLEHGIEVQIGVCGNCLQ